MPELRYRGGSAEDVDVCNGDQVQWVLTGSDREYLVDFMGNAPFPGASSRGSSDGVVSVTIDADAGSYDYGVSFEGDGLTARVWEGESRAAAATWPAFDAGAGLLTLQIEERRIDRLSGTARAEYVVQPDPPDGVVLRIVEEYRVADKGASLIGTTTVFFQRGGEPRGSYVLHRRFERAP